MVASRFLPTCCDSLKCTAFSQKKRRNHIFTGKATQSKDCGTFPVKMRCGSPNHSALAKIVACLAKIVARLAKIVARLAKIAVRLAKIAVRLAKIAVRLAKIAVRLAKIAVRLAKIAVRLA